MPRTNNKTQGRVIKSSTVDIQNLWDRTNNNDTTMTLRRRVKRNPLVAKYDGKSRTDLMKDANRLEKLAKKSEKLAKKSLKQAKKEKDAQETLTRQHVRSIADMLISTLNNCQDPVLRDDMILDVVCHMASSLKSNQQVTDAYVDATILLEDS